MRGEAIETAILVRAAKAGDQDAGDELFGRHYPYVSRIVGLRLGRTLRQMHEVDDIVQEAFLDAVRGLDRFEFRGDGAFRHWLAGVVENNIRDEVRRRGTLKRGGGLERPVASCGTSILSGSVWRSTDPSPSDVAAGNELEERIEAALLRLDERSRRAIEMRRISGLDYSEVARELGLGTESSARALVARAMARLAGLL